MIHPNYKHRTFVSGNAESKNYDDMDLIDCIGLSVEQAEAMILQMQDQFSGHGNPSTDSVNFSVLESIRKEVLDIKVVVNWHFQNQLDKQVENNHE